MHNIHISYCVYSVAVIPVHAIRVQIGKLKGSLRLMVTDEDSAAATASIGSTGHKPLSASSSNSSVASLNATSSSLSKLANTLAEMPMEEPDSVYVDADDVQELHVTPYVYSDGNILSDIVTSIPDENIVTSPLSPSSNSNARGGAGAGAESNRPISSGPPTSPKPFLAGALRPAAQPPPPPEPLAEPSAPPMPDYVLESAAQAAAAAREQPDLIRFDTIGPGANASFRNMALSDQSAAGTAARTNNWFAPPAASDPVDPDYDSIQGFTFGSEFRA